MVSREGGAIEFRILGRLEVLVGGRPLELAPAKARALLALLLLSPGRPLAMEQLIDELWRGAPPESAEASLRVLVSRLRKSLADAGAPIGIATRSPGYALDVDGGEIDAQRFEALLARGRDELARGDAESAATSFRDALGLWRGHALADVATCAAAAAEAARLDEERLVALEERIEADLACGRHRMLVAELESLVREHPFRERLWGARMLALYRCGRQADALAAFTELRHRLVEELGIEPAPELRTLHGAILAQDPTLTVTPGAAPGSAPASVPTGVVTFLLTDIEGSSGLWEREPERMAAALERHDRLVAEAVAGASGVLVKAKGEGDSTFSVFTKATQAVAAALHLHEAIANEPWPEGFELRVRLALHTGEAEERGGDYFGSAVNRAARLRALARPGQVLLSQATAHLIGGAVPDGTLLVDLGRRGLRGHDRDEHVYELRPATEVVSPAAEAFVRELPRELTPHDDTMFVGREAEMGHLADLWQAALGGTRQVALLGGEPGIGKTRLAAEIARRAHDEGAVVLFGRCDEDLGVPYQPFAEALRAYVTACPTTELADQVGRNAGDLARLVPEVGERLLGARPVGAGDPEHERDRLFAAIAALLSVASQVRPIVLVLDDLQWAAKPSLLMLHHLLRSPAPMRLLVVGTYRDTELDRAHPLAELLADLRRQVSVERLRLKGLSADAVGEYFQGRADAPLETQQAALAHQLHESTEGNPFFIVEVLRHLADAGVVQRDQGRWVAAAEIEDLGLPEGVKEVISRRLSRLSEEANRALAVASVVGPTFTLPLLEGVPDAGDDSDRLLDTIEEALRAGLILENSPGSYSFSHALIRQTLYAELTSTRRARLHRRVGEAIEQSPDPDLHVEALAHHFAEAALDGQIGKAAEYSLAAGRRALERLAHEEAVTQLQRGLELLDLDQTADDLRRGDLLLALAQARRELGDLEGNRELSLRAAEAARSLGSAEQLARAALVYWSVGGFSVTDPVVPELCEDALAMLGEAEPALRASLLARHTHYRAIAGNEGFALADQAEQALALARETGDRAALAATLRVKIGVLYGSERILERLATADELVELGRRAGDERSVLTGLAFRNDAYVELADRAAYDANLEELRRRTAQRGTRLAKHLIAVAESMDALLAGRFEEAAALSENALAHGGARADPRSAHRGRMAHIARDQGRLEEAITHSYAHLERVPAQNERHAFIAACLAEAGDLLAAERSLAAFDARDLPNVPRGPLWPVTLSHLAEACVRVGDRDRAAHLYEHLRHHRGHLVILGGYVAVGAADRFLGMLAATLGRLEDADAHYRAALEQEERMLAQPLAARTRLWHARMLLERDAPGDRDHAARLVEAAVTTAEELGMRAVAREAGGLAAARP